MALLCEVLNCTIPTQLAHFQFWGDSCEESDIDFLRVVVPEGEVGFLLQCFNPTCQTLVSFSFSPFSPPPSLSLSLSLSRALTHTRPGYTRSRLTGGRSGGRAGG